MTLIESRTDRGVVVVEQAADYSALRRALQQYDAHLDLTAWPQPAGPPLYKVLAMHPDRPPATVLVWQNGYGEALPLSSRLLEEVKRLDRNTRGEYLSEDELNAKRRAEIERQAELDNEAAVDDWTFKHGRPVLPRSQSLRMARDKRRNRGEKC